MMKSKVAKNGVVILGILYILISFISIVGEYEKDVNLIKLSKPFLIPLLGLIYFFSSKNVNRIYILALFFAWLGNLFFINITQESVYNGAISYFVFWILITFLILMNSSFPKKSSFAIAVIPFLFIYCCVLELIYESVEHGIYLFFLNGSFMVFLGAYSLANYFIDSSKPNTYLLISVLLFTFIQFIVSIDLYYLSIKFFRPIAILLFVSAQYFLLKTIVSYERVNSDNNTLTTI